MIVAERVSKRYGSYYAVKDASVAIEKERITALIGPNGAGKSTLLSLMSRLLTADEGQVYIEGQPIQRWKPDDLAKRLSILKQSNHLTLRLTVRDLVGFGRFPHSRGRLTPEDEEHVDRAIRYMDLTALQHKFLDELSGGERQRAFLAMVLAQDTDAILLDEPLNNLDMKHAVEIMKMLRRLVDDMGKTVVLVLHDVNFAACYADDIVAMKQGTVLRAGPVEEIIDPDVLRDVYDMDIRVEQFQCHRVCLYFQ